MFASYDLANGWQKSNLYGSAQKLWEGDRFYCFRFLQAIIQKGSGSRAVSLPEFQDLISEALISKVNDIRIAISDFCNLGGAG